MDSTGFDKRYGLMYGQKLDTRLKLGIKDGKAFAILEDDAEYVDIQHTGDEIGDANVAIYDALNKLEAKLDRHLYSFGNIHIPPFPLSINGVVPSKAEIQKDQFELDSIKIDRSKEWGFGEYDLDKLSVALVVSIGEYAIVLEYAGRDITMEITETGLGYEADLLGLIPESDGLWIWEGTYTWHDGPFECPQDGTMEPNGKFRRLTIEEMELIAYGARLWDQSEWKAPEDERLAMEAKYSKD